MLACQLVPPPLFVLSDVSHAFDSHCMIFLSTNTYSVTPSSFILLPLLSHHPTYIFCLLSPSFQIYTFFSHHPHIFLKRILLLLSPLSSPLLSSHLFSSVFSYLQQAGGGFKTQYHRSNRAQPQTPQGQGGLLQQLMQFLPIILLVLMSFSSFGGNQQQQVPYFTLPYLTLPYLTLCYLTLCYLTLPYVTLPYLTLPYLTLCYLMLPYLTSPYLALFYLMLISLHTQVLTLACENVDVGLYVCTLQYDI